MRNPELYLVEMVQAAQRIASYTAGLSRAEFLIHAYHAIDYSLVWRTATATIPTVTAAVRSIEMPAEPDSAG